MNARMTPQELLDEAEALERAAAAAFHDGDLNHQADLKARAQWARRTARERAAGVKSWPMVSP